MYKLGRKPHNADVLAAMPRHNFGTARPSDKLDRSKHDFKPAMFNNDDYPNCTLASLAECAIGDAALQGYSLIVAPGAPLAEYCKVEKIPDDVAAQNSNGAVMSNVLAYQAAHGYDIGNQVLYCTSKTIDLDRNSLALGLDQIGTLWMGVTLYQADMDAVTDGKIWDVVPGVNYGEPIGGHAMCAWDYDGLGDTDTLRWVTWGQYVKVTWRWVHARMSEAHGPHWPDLKAAH